MNRAAANEPLEGVAIVGMAGRFPGARDVTAFWANVKNGVESIARFSDEELEVPPPRGDGEHGGQYVKAKGILADVDRFDARFFGFLPREAELMDPQHRVFLELCWEAMEHAGCDPERYPGAVGVYAGCYVDTYLLANLCSHRDFLNELVDSIQVGSLQTELGNDKDYLATRVSFKLGLRGPSLTVQSACSTSLVAIALACQSLLSHQSDMALAGGVTITFPQRKGYFYREGGMLSGDGHCRAFDHRAQGTVFSNGAAVVVLKRLADAVADGDTIYAVIKGSALNNDGAQKISYTAPSVDGQAEVIALALAMAGWDAGTMGYVEAHGTATPIGDPIEIAALTRAYRQTTDATGYCAIGSVKTNLGHLDVASGAVGIIKTALALHHGVLPPSLHFERPNPGIDFTRTPFYVNTELRPWPPTAWPRRAGISSFGVGGTNAHLVLEEAPAARSSPGRAHSLLVLSARTDAALAAMSARLADALEADAGPSLEDVAYTLQVGRKVFERRRAIVGASRAEAIEALRRAPAAPDAATSERGDPPLVFMFPGQGAQYPNMGRELYDTEQVFRDTIDECADHLRAGGHLGEDLRAALYPRAGDEAAAAARLTETSVSQPALLAVEVALARLLARWGIAPMAVLGHSVGELAAACVAGVFSLETAVKAVAARGRLMQAQPPGRMLAVRMPAAELEALLSPELALAAVNAPGLSVASGPAPAVEALQTLLAGRGVAASPLRTSHAFHSAMMEPAVPALTAEVARLTLAAPTIPVFSTVLGRPLTAHEATDPAYWGRQLRATVRFADALAAAAAEPGRLFLEVGPGQTLQQLARQSAVSGGRNVLSCLGPLQAPGSDVAQLLAAVGRLWVAGKPVHFEDLAHGDRRRIPLPTYPFERKRFWVDPAPARPDPSSAPSGSRPAPATRPPALAAPAGAPAIPAPVGAAAGSGRTQDLIRHQLDIMAEQLALFGRGRETRRKD